MTGLLAIPILCAGAALGVRINMVKGRDAASGGIIAFLLGPLGVAYTAANTPPEPGVSRWVWLRDSISRWLLATYCAVLVAVVIVVIVLAARPNTVSGAEIDGRLTKWLVQQGASQATVECPSFKLKAGYVFLCTVRHGEGVKYLRVTIDNANGDMEWQAVGG